MKTSSTRSPVARGGEVHVPNRYQYKRTIAAVGETFEGATVAVHRVGRIKPAVPA